MSQPLFTAEELAELAAFDAEIDDDDELTLEEFSEAAQRDSQAIYAQKDNKAKKIAAYHRAYYEANKEEIAAKQRAYREANKEEIAAYHRAYYEANKEEIAAKHRAYCEANKEKIRKHNREYMREYRRRKKENEARLVDDPGMA